MKKVKLTTEGIKKHLNSTTPAQAISEYIWNGLDAQATEIDVSYIENSMGGLDSLVVSDNGVGICSSLLDDKFGVFLESEKIKDRVVAKRTSSDMHGKDGIGRLTFFTFAQKAEWNTVYAEAGRKYSYSIGVSADDLVSYPSTAPREVSQSVNTGTTVKFSLIDSSLVDLCGADFLNFVVAEFCWKLFLNPKLFIRLQGVALNPAANIAEQSEFCPIGIDGQKSNIHFVRWKNKLHGEYSRYYFTDSVGIERFTDFTSLNKKGDSFHHSVYVRSEFFDTFTLSSGASAQNELEWGENTIKSEWYKRTLGAADRFLKDARKLFLRTSKDDLILKYEEKGIFPAYNGKNQWEVVKHAHLAETIGELYNIQPSLLTNGTTEQKKILVRLIEQLLDSSGADSLYQIIGQVIDLDDDERSEFLDVLKSSRLSSVIKTARLVQDRYRAIEQIKRLNWDSSLNAKEVPHIQEFMEKHFWMLGEEFSLVVAAEKDFEQALRGIYEKVRRELEDGKLEHPDKNKEVDILLIRQDRVRNKVHNVVIELKHPSKSLGKRYYRQIETYFELIYSESRFNAENWEWSYYLVGNKFDGTGFIEAQLENAKVHAEPSLAFKAKNHKIYVKKWSDLISDVELRHQFLNDRLQIQREQIALEEGAAKTADEIIDRASALTCAAP